MRIHTPEGPKRPRTIDCRYHDAIFSKFMVEFDERNAQQSNIVHASSVIGSELLSLEPVTMGRACITCDFEFIPPAGWFSIQLGAAVRMYHMWNVTNEDFVENVKEYVTKLRTGNANERRYAMMYLARVVCPTIPIFNRYVHDWVNATSTGAIETPHLFYVNMTTKSASDIMHHHLTTLHDYCAPLMNEVEIAPVHAVIDTIVNRNFAVNELIDILYDIVCMQIVKNMSDMPEYNEQGHCQVIHKSAYIRMSAQIHEVAVILREGFKRKDCFFRKSICNEKYTGVEFQRITRSILSLLFVMPPTWVTTNEVVFHECTSTVLPTKLTQTFSNSLNAKFVDQLVVNGINSQFMIPQANVLHVKRKRHNHAFSAADNINTKRLKPGADMESVLNTWRKNTLFDTTHGRTGANEQAIKPRDVYGYLPVALVTALQSTGPSATITLGNRPSFKLTLFHVNTSEYILPYPQSLFMWDVFAGTHNGIELLLFDKQRFTFQWADDKQSYSGNICHSARVVTAQPALKAYHGEFTNIVNPNQTSQRITHKQTRQYVTLITQGSKLVQVQFVMCLGTSLLTT